MQTQNSKKNGIISRRWILREKKSKFSQKMADLLDVNLQFHEKILT